MIMTVEERMENLFTRGVASFVDPSSKFKEKLLKKAKGEISEDVIIKFGVDPTRPDLHLGHAVVLHKLRKFQDLGCKVVFLVGDFTASIGDPTGKSKVRPMVEQKEIEENMETYLRQVSKILLTTSQVFSWIRNSDWFYGVSDMLPKEGLNLDFWGRGINPSSFLGKAFLYEKTRMQVRDLKKQEEQAVMSIDILVGTEGKEKMSKSLDNYISINDEPRDMFGKVMSIPDTVILNYYQLCTSADKERLKGIEVKLKDPKINPRDIKLDLAQEIVAIYHGADNALGVREAFLATFQKKEIPEGIEEIRTNEGEILADLLVRSKAVSSKSDLRRLVEEGAVKRLREAGAEEKIVNYLEVATPGVYKIGKRRFVKII